MIYIIPTKFGISSLLNNTMVDPNSIDDKSVRKGIIILRGVPQRRSTLSVTLLLKTMYPNMKQHIMSKNPILISFVYD